jgi:hypothetical protein
VDDQGRERRAFPRFATSLRARVLDESGRPVEGEVVNLSESGALISTEHPPRTGRVRIELELDEHGWQVVDAEVVRSEEAAPEAPGRLAAQFAGVAASGGREAIRAFLQEHFA